MRKQDIQILAGTAAVITVFAVFHRILLVVLTVCLLALGAALSASFYYLQDLGLDRSSPSETDQANPTIITRARGSIMSVYL